MRGRINWRHLLALYFAWLLLQGAVRKWVVSGVDRWVFVAGDLLLLAAYGTFLLQRWRSDRLGRIRVPRHPVVLAAALVGALALAAVLNPAYDVPVVKITGLRYYVVYLPLVVLPAYAFGSPSSVRRAARAFAATLVPIVALALVETASPPGSLLGAYAVREAGVDMFGAGFIRASSTFPYITPYTTYLRFAAFACVALLLTARQRKERWIATGLLGIAFVGMFASGSRGVVYFSLGGLGVVGLGLVVHLELSSGRLGHFFLAAAVAGGVLLAAFPGLVEGFMERAAQIEHQEWRAKGMLLSPVRTLERVPLLGYGVGASYQAATRVAGEAAAETLPPWGEVSTDRVTNDLGLPGLLAQLFLVFAVLGTLVRVYLRAEDREVKLLALAAIGYAAGFYVTLPVYNYTAMAFYCFTAGVAVYLAQLSRIRAVRRAGIRDQPAERSAPRGGARV